jgi:hypothetical protein
MRPLRIIGEWLKAKPLRIYFSSVLLAALPVGLFLITAHQVLMSQIMSRSKTQIHQSAKNIAFLFDEHLAGSITLVSSFAGRPAIIRATEQEESEELAERLSETHRLAKRFEYLAVVANDGRIRAIVPSKSADRGENLSGRDWFQYVSRERKPYISSLHVLGDGKTLAITLASPIFSD